MKKRILFFVVGGLSLGLSLSIANTDVPKTNQPVINAEVSPDPHSQFPAVVIKTSPVSGSTNVDPNLKEISVTFSKTMTNNSWSWTTAPYSEFPEITSGPAYDEKLKTCTINVSLKPNTTYATWLNSENFGNFRDASGKPSVPYLLVFTTGAGTSVE